MPADPRRSKTASTSCAGLPARLLGQRTAATYLGIGERTFEKQWRAGDMPQPHRIGRRILWDRKLLDRWADEVSGLEQKPNFFGD